jgi:hypothetical protein
MPTNVNPSITRSCLNGWWDFQPVMTDGLDGQVDLSAGVPQSAWLAGALLVPSTWNKPLDAVRQPGETRWTCAADTHSPEGAVGHLVPEGTEYPKPGIVPVQVGCGGRSMLDRTTQVAGAGCVSKASCRVAGSS